MDRLDGDARAAGRARAAVRQLADGEFKLIPDPEAGHLVAYFGLNRMPLLRAAGGVRTAGSGGRISHTSTRASGLRINAL
jgi:hypothetical protein